MHKSQTIVIGGGLVGLAIAYGLARLGQQVSVLDDGDNALRAARGNFGLLWVQGKGYGMQAYAEWTRQAVGLWPEFAALLRADCAIDVKLRQPGGFQLCLSDAELREEAHRLQWLQQALADDYPFEVLEPAALRQRLPGIGPEVVGACYSPMDGHVNPLKLLRALHAACQARGVQLLSGQRVTRLSHSSNGFSVHSETSSRHCDQLVLAAGLGNRALAAQLGHNVPVEPSRGQILVTERLAPFLHYPTSTVRQTDEGSVQLGDSVESVGLDDGTSSAVLSDIARRGVQCFPHLADVRMVRAWGALRIMSPDGAPIYQALSNAPGAYVVSCHSGVTLAAAHTLQLASWINGQANLPAIEAFGLQRFTDNSEVHHGH